MDPDWSIKNKKHDGFLRLISAVYDIFAALLSSDADVLVMKRPCRCLTAYSIMPLGGSAKSSLCRTTLLATSSNNSTQWTAFTNAQIPQMAQPMTPSTTAATMPTNVLDTLSPV